MKKLKSILLIDDDPVANFVHQDIINSLNVAEEIQVANNGQDALILINQLIDTRNDFPRLILLDLNMPVMDGFEFLKTFRQQYPHLANIVKVVILSSSSNTKDIEEAGMLDVDDYLVKPLSDQKIKILIQDHFERENIKPSLNKGLNL